MLVSQIERKNYPEDPHIRYENAPTLHGLRTLRITRFIISCANRNWVRCIVVMIALVSDKTGCHEVYGIRERYMYINTFLFEPLFLIANVWNSLVVDL